MRKITASALCGLAVFGAVNGEIPAYSAEINVPNDSIRQENIKSSQEIYLEAGEGTLGLGDGSKENPYKNIRTALENIKDGQTLVLVGKVVYTDYKTHVDNSALPLFIDKDITITGISESSSLTLRAPIQLGADVEFKDMKLEMVPEVSLGGGSDGSSSRKLGADVPRSATVFVAGHSLTLNNVDTTQGTNPEQYNQRPYISGGAFKGQGELGDKSIINIINPNEETKISAIYAGDYYNDMDMDVEINIDGKLIDTELYTGGVGNNVLKGKVTVNLSGKSNVTSFSKENHEGELNVTFNKGYLTSIMNFDDIDTLTLEEDSRATLPENGIFNVKDVILNKNSVLDFRKMDNNPIVNGNFTGVKNQNDPLECGVIILNTDQTLNIGGAVTGLTRLNSNGVENIDTFKSGHQYVNADLNSTGDFSIEGTQYTRFVLNKNEEVDKITWTADCVDKEIKEVRWAGGEDKIVNPQIGEYYAYPIEFIDVDGKAYKPSLDQLYNEFSYVLIKQDNTEIEADSDDSDIDFYYNSNFSDDINELNQLEFAILNSENLYGEIKIIVKHLDSQEQIVRTIKLISDLDEEDKPGTEGGDKEDNPGGKPEEPGDNSGVEKPEPEEPGDNEEENNPGAGTPEEPGDNEEEDNPGAGTPENLDTSKLKELYDKCINSSYKKSKYTKASFEKYENELKNAKNVLNNEKASQSHIDKAYENLKKAVNGLKKVSSSSGGSGGSGSSSKEPDSAEKNDTNLTDWNTTVDVDKHLTDANKPGSDNDNANISENKNHTWKLSNGSWTITSSDGTLVKGWHKDETSGKWYMLDRNTGNMITGWHKDIDGKWYHLSSSGEMSTGWVKDSDGKWYHLSSSGEMENGIT